MALKAAAMRRSAASPSSVLPAAASRSPSSLVKKSERPSLQTSATPQAKRIGTVGSLKTAKSELRGNVALKKPSKVAKFQPARSIQVTGTANRSQPQSQPAVQAAAVLVTAEPELSLLELWKKNDPELYQLEVEFIEELLENSRKEEEERKKQEEENKREEEKRKKEELFDEYLDREKSELEVWMWNKVEELFNAYLDKEIEKQKRKKEEEEKRAQMKLAGWEKLNKKKLIFEKFDLLKKWAEGKMYHVSLSDEIKRKRKEQYERLMEREERNKEIRERREERDEEERKEEADFWKKYFMENELIDEALKRLANHRKSMRELWEEIKTLSKYLKGRDDWF